MLLQGVDTADEDEKFKGKVRSILNKLTPEKFERLFEQAPMSRYARSTPRTLSHSQHIRAIVSSPSYRGGSARCWR